MVIRIGQKRLNRAKSQQFDSPSWKFCAMRNSHYPHPWAGAACGGRVPRQWSWPAKGLGREAFAQQPVGGGQPAGRDAPDPDQGSGLRAQGSMLNVSWPEPRTATRLSQRGRSAPNEPCSSMPTPNAFSGGFQKQFHLNDAWHRGNHIQPLRCRQKRAKREFNASLFVSVCAFISTEKSSICLRGKAFACFRQSTLLNRLYA